MRATLSVAALRKALVVAVRPVERRTTIPVLECLHLSVAGGRLHAQGTNLDVWASSSVLAADCQKGAICVGRRFVDLVRALPAFDLITIKAEDGRLVVETPDGRASFITIPASDFPEPSKVQAVASFDIATKDLRSIIERVGRFISTEETRYYLNGICLTSSGGRDLRFAATDGHTLGEATHILPGDLPEARCIVPRETIAALKAIKFDAEQTRVEYLTKSERPDHVRFTCGDVVVLSKLIDGTFPNYGRVIPADFASSWEIGRTSWLGAVRRVSILRHNNQSAVLVSADRANRLSFSVKREDFGEMVVAAKGKRLTGQSIEFFCNAELLREVLSAHHSDPITLSFKDGNNPLLFESAQMKTVLMPMRGGFKALELPDDAEAA